MEAQTHTAQTGGTACAAGTDGNTAQGSLTAMNSTCAEPASVDVLLTNLIRGNLLSSFLLWITTRPAAADQILLQYVNQITEVRGFSDLQKEEYFRKRFEDQSLAEKIITHRKSSRSLYIMCHIPVFCWISATVLEKMLREAKSEEIPKTLTQMFMYFLNFQIKHSNQKYRGASEIDHDQTRKIILALGKLAFQHLENGNLIFYEEDLRECGIVVRESVHSEICTQIFRKESALHLEKELRFIHLSVQEFLAALYAFLSFISDSRNVLEQVPASFNSLQMSDFLRFAVDKALQSQTGHLDLFLRFLLGLSLESSQTLLRGLVPQTGKSSYRKEQIVRYIKEKIRENPSLEKSINLFHCLNELNDHSLVQEVQTYLSRRAHSCFCGAQLSPALWSALVFVLLNSDDRMDEFDLRKYDKCDECLLRLLPVVTSSRKAVLRGCNLTEKSCEGLASALSSDFSCLRELDLSDNKLHNSGAQKLSAGLKNANCKLEKLMLESCSITEEGCANLFKALKLNPSHLRELDLTLNTPGLSGVKALSDLLNDSYCKLEKLRLELCPITEKGLAALVKALNSNPSYLKELNLSRSNTRDSGVKKLLGLLEDPNCILEKLLLEYCKITGKGVAALVKALKSNPSSHLRELTLSCNKPGESGVKELSDLLMDPHCKLEKLNMCNSGVTSEGCADLVKALKSNPSSHLKVLKLGVNRLVQDSGAKEFSELLKDPHCQLKKLQLYDCKITGEGCSAVVKALKSNPSSHLRELDLSWNKLGDSVLKEFSELLEGPQCKLEILQLSGCFITGEGYAALFRALKSNPSSHLRDLRLNSNNPGESAVKELSELLMNPNCKLEKLQLSECDITDEGCATLTKVMKSNPSSRMRELILDDYMLGYSGDGS